MAMAFLRDDSVVAFSLSFVGSHCVCEGGGCVVVGPCVVVWFFVHFLLKSSF